MSDDDPDSLRARLEVLPYHVLRYMGEAVSRLQCPYIGRRLIMTGDLGGNRSRSEARTSYCRTSAGVPEPDPSRWWYTRSGCARARRSGADSIVASITDSTEGSLVQPQEPANRVLRTASSASSLRHSFAGRRQTGAR